MIKKVIIPLLICTGLLLCGCDELLQPAPTATPNTNLAVDITPTPQITQVPLATEVPTATPEPTDVPTATPIPTATPVPSPPNTMEFYSCYAHMVSYNPSNGWAEFDYFYMHTGQDAIDYLVENEGYTLADATDEVNNFAEGEFVEENNNPGLRTIDLDLVVVKTIVNADGSVGPDLNGIVADTAHLNSLYSANPNNLLNYFFYYVKCDSNGNVIEVKQIYRP